MKRKIFFLLERLKVTPGERKTVTGLLIVMLILALVNLGLSPSVPFEDGNYKELEKQFRKRTAKIKADNKKLMQRYNPTPKIEATKKDTTTADTTKQDTREKSGKAHKKVNINNATQSQLEALPGIGPTYARRIIAYRKKNSGFNEISELKKISGIAQKRLDNLKPFIKLKDS